MLRLYRVGNKLRQKNGWNDTGKKNPKYSERNLSQCHSVYHKSHTGFTGNEPLLCHERPATNRLNHGSVDNCKQIRTQNTSLRMTHNSLECTNFGTLVIHLPKNITPMKGSLCNSEKDEAATYNPCAKCLMWNSKIEFCRLFLIKRGQYSENSDPRCLWIM